MKYLWTFLSCYLAVGFFVVSNFIKKNNHAASLLGGKSSPAVQNFLKIMWSQSSLLLLRATFVIGTIAGVVISILIWIFSK